MSMILYDGNKQILVSIGDLVTIHVHDLPSYKIMLMNSYKVSYADCRICLLPSYKIMHMNSYMSMILYDGNK
jgi:hypothetical protein